MIDEIMGNSIKGNRKRFGKSGKSKNKIVEVGVNDQSSSGVEYQDIELVLLRRTIQNDPECFILNNLMMCVQFFKNYDEEIEEIRETLVSSREAGLNAEFLPQKYVLLPDVLQEHLTNNVSFTSTRQLLKPTIEPLHPIRMYVVHDNIEITEQNYPSYYSTVNDTITYNMSLQPTQNQGYVKLQLLDETPLKKNMTDEETELSSVVEDDDDEIYTIGYGNYGSKKKESTKKRTRSNKKVKSYQGSPERHEKTTNRSPTSSTSSGYRSGGAYVIDSDSDCNYNSQMNLEGKTMMKDYMGSETVVIPRHCFEKITYTSDGEVYDSKFEEKQMLNSKQMRIKMALRRHNYDVLYLSSSKFMSHFVYLFHDRIAPALEFDRETLDNVQAEGCVIYCDKVNAFYTVKHGKIESYEVIPSIALDWPVCAREWFDRPRSTWPDDRVIEKIKEFGCYIVPEGFIPKTGINSNENIEWKFVFPTAERYLETCMTHAQVQVYLISLMLHKTFLKPVFDTIYGLTTFHIRNKLFWMIEEDDRPTKWPDNRIGECLLKLLSMIYNDISQNQPHLPDYFLRKRNFLNKVPANHILHTQKQLKRIIENPVMYIFHAMENIRHSSDFFPRLDFDMLLKILTVDALALVNPSLARHVFRPLQKSLVNYEDEVEEGIKDDKFRWPGGFWDNVKTKSTEGKEKLNQLPVTNKTLINPRKASDSIIQISTRCAELEGPRLSALLDFFIRHFLKMAERCYQYRADKQKTVYLNQAEKLSILLSEHLRFKDDAKAYLKKIQILKNKTVNGRTREKDEAPETPQRNNEAPVFVASMKDRFAVSSMVKNLEPIPINLTNDKIVSIVDSRKQSFSTETTYV